jgi:MFS family permease
MTWPESLLPLRQPRFAWYFAARLVATAGTTMSGVALAFAVLDISDSPSALGWVLAAHTIPLVLFLLVGGVIADRFPRAAVLQFSNISSAALQGIAAWLVISGQAEIWMLIVLQFGHGMTSAVGFPAMAAMVPQLVQRDQLQRANVLLSMSRGALTIVGPTAAAVLVVTVGPGWALAVDASTWAIAAVLMTPIRRATREPRDRDAVVAASPNMIRELREGWSVFVGTTWLWVVVAAFGVLNAIHMGAIFTLGPPLAKDTIGERGWGYALSAESLGLLLMTIVLLKVRLRYPLRAGMVGMAALALPILALGLGPELGILLLVMFLAGAGAEVFSLGWNLAMQENIEEDKLSRAYSYDALGSFVAMPIGQLLYGPLGEAFGYEPVLVASAVVYLAVCVATLLSRSVRNLGRPAPTKAGRLPTPT